MKLKVNSSNEKYFITGLIIALTVCFAMILMLVFLPKLQYCMGWKRILFFASCFSSPLLLIGFYFGLRRKTDLSVLAFLLIISGIAIVVRISLFDYKSADYNIFLSSWVQTLRETPGLSAWRLNLGDYNMPYLYLLTLIAKLPLEPLYMIKLFSILFDFILAYYVMQISFFFVKSPIKQVAVYVAILFLPTVILNGAYWAQCDVVYSALAIGGLYYGLSDRPKLCVIFFALAFSFKLQTIFLMPILLPLCFTHKIQLKHLLLFPIVFLVTLIPALLAGKSFISTISIYVRQASQYPSLTLNAPTIYQLFNGDGNFAMFQIVGIMLAGAAVVVVLYYAWMKRKVMDKQSLLMMSFLFVLLIPYLLPRMHERYFYLADLLAFVPLWFNPPKRWFVPLIVVYVSFRSYTVFLFQNKNVQFLSLSIMLLLIIGLVTWDLVEYVRTKEQSKLIS